MRWLLFGALIGVLLAVPSLLTFAAALAAALLGKPMLPRIRRWSR